MEPTAVVAEQAARRGEPRPGGEISAHALLCHPRHKQRSPVFAEPTRGTREGEVAAPEPCGTWHRANPVSPLKPRGLRADPGCCWGSAATPALRRVPVCALHPAPQTGTVLGKLCGARQDSALVAESRVGAPLLHRKISFCRCLLLLLPFAHHGMMLGWPALPALLHGATPCIGAERACSCRGGADTLPGPSSW